MKHQLGNYVEKTCQKNEEDMNCNYQREEPNEIENFPTNAQGSASAPILTREKPHGSVNLRETSSWDTPSTSVEPIKSIEVLKDAAYGIGDQPFSVENEITLEDEKAGDTHTCLKGDSAFEDDSFSEDKTDDEVKNDSNGEKHQKSPHCFKENTDVSFKILQSKFECMKLSDNSETLEGDLNLNDSYQETSQTKDIKTCRKQLSPNPSFGFVPHLNKYDSEGEMRKKDSEDFLGKGFQSQIETNKMVTRKISETFQNLADEISCAETNFNAEFQNAKEISDVIQGRNNESRIKFDNELEQIENNGEDFIHEENNFMPERNSDKCDLDNMKNENNVRCNKIPLTFNITNGNMPGYFVSEKKAEDIKTDDTETMDSEEEKYSNKEKKESTFFEENDDDDDDDDSNDKSDSSEPQVNVDKTWKKRWYEAHPSLENFNNSQRRDPRLLRTHLPACSSNIGAAGDVPNDRFYIPNGVSSCYRNNHPRNSVTPESLGSIKEPNHSRILSDDASHRCSSARPIDKLSERKSSSEKISNANPQNIPYSWRKLSKQSHSSENMVNYSKESQVRLNEKTSSNSSREECTPSLNEVEALSETDVNESEEKFFEASEEIMDKANFGIKISSEGTLNQCEDIGREDVLDNLRNDENLKTQDAQLGISFKAGLYAESKDKNESKEHLYNQDGIISDQNVGERDEKLQSSEQRTTESIIEDHNGILFDTQKDKAVNELSSRSMKGEFGLNAACGDFVTSIDDTNEKDVNSQTSYIDTDENRAIEQNNESNGISEKYLEEVIERIIEQQKDESMHSYEGLNFSSYSESDSSRLEESSDLSETEDFSMNDSLQD